MYRIDTTGPALREAERQARLRRLRPLLDRVGRAQAVARASLALLLLPALPWVDQRLSLLAVIALLAVVASRRPRPRLLEHPELSEHLAGLGHRAQNTTVIVTCLSAALTLEPAVIREVTDLETSSVLIVSVLCACWWGPYLWWKSDALLPATATVRFPTALCVAVALVTGVLAFPFLAYVRALSLAALYIPLAAGPAVLYDLLARRALAERQRWS